jgi:hypothetical protein
MIQLLQTSPKNGNKLTSWKVDDSPEVSDISKSLPENKRTEVFDDFLSRTIGVRMILLSYVTGEKECSSCGIPISKSH